MIAYYFAMNALLIEYPTCSTCRKAHLWLEQSGAAFTTRHIVEANPSAEELAAWHKLSRLPLRRFFNTSGMKYRELNLATRLPLMSEKEMLALLASDGMLVKRPLLITDSAVVPGFREEVWRQALGM